MFILIVGGGKVGFNLAYTLAQEDKKDVTVIDKNKAALEKFKELTGVKTVHGDGTDPRILDYVGITRAHAVVAVTGSDVDNIALSMIAKRQFGIKRVIARINHIKNQWLYTGSAGLTTPSRERSLSPDHSRGGQPERPGHLVTTWGWGGIARGRGSAPGFPGDREEYRGPESS